MKRFISLVLVLLLTVTLFVGCSDDDSDSNTSKNKTSHKTQKPQDIETPPEAQEIEDVVEIYKEGSYHNAVSNQTCNYAMPLLTIESDDAEAFNKKMKDIYDSSLVDFENYANFEFGTGERYEGVNSIEYVVNLNDSILSLVVISHSTFMDEFYCINIILETGEEVTDDMLLQELSLDAEEIRINTKLAIKDYYEYTYGFEFTYSESNKDMLNKTLADKNIMGTRFYLGENKALYGIFDVYAAVQSGHNSATTKILTDISDIKDNMSMMDYNGLTVEDVASIWGDDYIIANSLYQGGWGIMYYDGAECPFGFYYHCYPQDMGRDPDAKEKLTGISWNDDYLDTEVFIYDDIDVTYNLSDYESSIPNGEFWENQMEGGYAYSYSYGLAEVTCCWYEKSTKESAEFIVVDYEK